MLRPNSDIYSLGVIWFELLSGVNYKMLPPGTTIRKFREDIPEDIMRLMESMLVKEEDQRLWDGKVLLEEFRALQKPKTSKPEEISVETIERKKDLESHKAAGRKDNENQPAETVEEAETIEQSSQNISISDPSSVQKNTSEQSSPKITKEQIPQEEPQAGEIRKVDLGDDISMEFVYVPSGVFWMGASKFDKQANKNEKPIHKVYLNAFWIGKYPVTILEYNRFIKETNHKPPSYWENGEIPKDKKDFPIFDLSWYDSESFTKWLSMKSGSIVKLPTEAQWEKAARGIDKRKYPWGNQFPNEFLVAFNRTDWYLTAVGKYPKGVSPFGVMDMSGSVQEWVRDWYDENYYRITPYINPQGPESGEKRVLRKGRFGTYTGTDGFNLRLSRRFGLNPEDLHFINGFRCVIEG